MQHVMSWAIGAFHSHMHLAAAAPQLPMYLTGPRDFWSFKCLGAHLISGRRWNILHCDEADTFVQIVVFRIFLSAKIFKWLTQIPQNVSILITSGLHTKVRDMLEYVPWKQRETEGTRGTKRVVCGASQGGAAVGRETLWWSHSFGQQRWPWNWRIGSHRLHQVTWRGSGVSHSLVTGITWSNGWRWLKDGWRGVTPSSFKSKPDASPNGWSASQPRLFVWTFSLRCLGPDVQEGNYERACQILQRFRDLAS